MGISEFSIPDPGEDSISRYYILESCSWDRKKEKGFRPSLKKCFKNYDYVLSVKKIMHTYFKISNNIQKDSSFLYLTKVAINFKCLRNSYVF